MHLIKLDQYLKNLQNKLEEEEEEDEDEDEEEEKRKSKKFVKPL